MRLHMLRFKKYSTLSIPVRLVVSLRFPTLRGESYHLLRPVYSWWQEVLIN